MVVQAPLPPAASVPFGFEKAALGETLAGWRRSVGGSASCAPRSSGDGVVVCGMAPVALGGDRTAPDVAFTFVNGRLARIRFRTSINAYDRVRARLDSRYGAPRPVTYGQIRIEHSIETPHVRAVWHNDRSTIVINDPDAEGTTLKVTYTLDRLVGALRRAAA